MDFLTNPFIVILMWLYQTFGQSLVLAIVIFTILTRVITYPLTAAQLKSSKKMQEVAPRLTELKEKYKNDREKQAQAQMTLYREAGVNPLGGCLPLLIQFPVLIGLYGAIYAGLAQTPLQFVDLTSPAAHPWSERSAAGEKHLPVVAPRPAGSDDDPAHPDRRHDLAADEADDASASRNSKDPSAAMSRNMTTIMPLMIGLFSLSFASGLSIYWVVSNVVGIVQYAMMGKVDWGAVFGRPSGDSARTCRPVESFTPREPGSRSASRKRELAASPSATVTKSGSASNRAPSASAARMRRLRRRARTRRASPRRQKGADAARRDTLVY